MADKKYQINFEMTDGSTQSVEFTVPQGEKGDTGKTAYQYAKEGGYTGTEGEFAEKLAREYPTKLSQLANDAGFITGYTETDPTVPAWAKAAKKPVYTAGEVGALPDTTVIPGKLSDLTADAAHRTVTDAEKSTWNAKANTSDIPTKVSELTNDKGFLTGYTETDPTVPAWAKAASKPSYTPSEVGALPNTTKIPSKTSDLTNDSGFITGYTETDPTVPGWAKASSKPSYSKSEVGLGNVENVKQYSASNPPPYPVTSVNGNTGAVVLDAAAVGARPSTWTPTAANVGAVPASRKVNGKALSADITLSAADVKAVPQTETMKLEGVDADGVSHVFTIYGVTGWSGADDPE
jgi:hypothetical protein